MTTNGSIKHVLEASNPLMGEARFVTLQLGETWDLGRGVGHPEINASHERGSVRWVANGDFWYVLYDHDRGWAMEFHGAFRPIQARKPKASLDVASVAGHAAQVEWRHRRRGLPWQRHDVHYLIVDYDCPQSERSVRLEFSGWCPDEGFREILGSLTNLGCH
jgi:hypothetical protein